VQAASPAVGPDSKHVAVLSSRVAVQSETSGEPSAHVMRSPGSPGPAQYVPSCPQVMIPAPTLYVICARDEEMVERTTAAKLMDFIVMCGWGMSLDSLFKASNSRVFGEWRIGRMNHDHSGASI
jgi:hypothetical protein